MRRLFIITLIFILPLSSKADEGMWLPILLEKLNIGDMQEKGLKLTAEDIYSVNQACLKDAIVLFGTGCTGEIISQDTFKIKIEMITAPIWSAKAHSGLIDAAATAINAGKELNASDL